MSELYEARTTQLIVAEYGKEMFDESATRVSIENDCCGEFVEVRQDFDDKEWKIRIMVEEWPCLREAINQMIGGCRKEEDVEKVPKTA